MKKITLVPVFAILLAGCATECKSDISIWLQDCTKNISQNKPDKTNTFNGIKANDAIFIPVNNPADEIFQKCQSIQPLSNKDASIYKKCLKKYISQIQSINSNNTRAEVNKILQQNGGVFSPQSAIYSHPNCEVLKVRVEFEFQRDENGRAKFDDNDKVKSISMPYLGYFISD